MLALVNASTLSFHVGKCARLRAGVGLLCAQTEGDMRREDPALRDEEGQDLAESFLLYHQPDDLNAPMPAGVAPRPLGRSKARGDVHRDGDWHRSVHVWLASDSSLLLQQRSELKDTFPGRWDVSCAGHMSGNDGSLESAVRELEEELGLSVDQASMQRAFVCTVPSEVSGATESHGAFVCREMQDIYLLRLEDVLPKAVDASASLEQQLTLGAGEVAGVELRAAEVVDAAWAAEDANYVPRPEHYRVALREALAQI